MSWYLSFENNRGDIFRKNQTNLLEINKKKKIWILRNSACISIDLTHLKQTQLKWRIYGAGKKWTRLWKEEQNIYLPSLCASWCFGLQSLERILLHIQFEQHFLCKDHKRQCYPTVKMSVRMHVLKTLSSCSCMNEKSSEKHSHHSETTWRGL